MKSTSLLRVANLATTIILLTSLLSATALAQSGFTITPVVTRGARVSDTGKERFFKNYIGYLSGFRALNNQGDVVVTSSVGGNCISGTYLISKEKITPLADLNCTSSPIGQFRQLENTSLNDSGKAVLVGRIATTTLSKQAIFSYSDGKLETIISEGDRTPLNTIFKATLAGVSYPGPMINHSGEIAFSALTEDLNGQRQDVVFVYADGVIRKVVATGDASPVFGKFGTLFNIPQSARINDQGEVLFYADSVSDDRQSFSYGFFLSTAEGFKKVIATPDRLPTGRYFQGISCIPDLNNQRQVVFSASNGGAPDYPAGIFLWSEGEISKIALAGESTPIGGQFALQSINTYHTPRINNNGAIAFGSPIKDGNTSFAIFLASQKALLKVVAVGDRLPTREKITALSQFALNDLGQIAFLAYSNKFKPAGIFIATPLTPETSKIEFLQNNGVYELRVNGHGFITNDTVIEVNGIALEVMTYPADAREEGDTSVQIISRDARLEQLLQSGQTAQITIFNALTNRRSLVKEFAR